MKNKAVAISLLVFLTLAFTLQPTTSSAHVANPGAKIRGFIIPQPEFADLKEGVAWVLAAEIGIVPEHKSKVTGVGFLLEDSEEPEEIKLNSSIPAGKMTTFTLRIGYPGKPGDVVPTRRVRLTLDQVRVYSLGHGEDQQVEIIEPPPVPPQEDTITLR